MRVVDWVVILVNAKTGEVQQRAHDARLSRAQAVEIACDFNRLSGKRYLAQIVPVAAA